MFSRIAFFIVLVLGVCLAQNAPQQTPQVRVNYLNVCTPPDADVTELSTALGRIPAGPQFSDDFEVARGRSSMSKAELVLQGASEDPGNGNSSARWVRIRRDFPESSALLNVQYSVSVNDRRVSETLVFRVRDPKDLMQVSLSDTVTGDPSTVLATDTPPERIRIERFGKPSIVLAHCVNADQSKYASAFQNANKIMSDYRSVLQVKTVAAQDLARISSATRAGKTSAKGKP